MSVSPAPVTDTVPAPPPPSEQRKRWPILLAATALIAGGLLWWFHTPSPAVSAKRPAPVIPVLVSAVTRGDLPVYLNALGTVTAEAHVTVRSRVDGPLAKVLFKEGQMVTAGDVLAEIDPRPYEVRAAQAEGQWRRDQALLKNAKLDLERARALWAQRAIPEQSFVAQEAAVATQEASLMSAQAQFDEAKLQLAYTQITAPISGRAGFRQVDAGNLIRASDPNGLLTITQINPITVVFTLPQDQVPAVLTQINAGKKLVVEIFDRERKTKLAAGALRTVNNEIDPSTGTLKCKAEFDNSDGSLFPNQFVTVRLLVETKPSVVLAPLDAIQRGAQQSTYVYVIKPAGDTAKGPSAEGTASIRKVTLGLSEKGLVEVREGLSAGELVALEGVDRLQEGSKVAPKPASP